MTEMEARAIIRLGEKNTVCELVRLSGIIDVLAARLAALEARLAKDSHNSSKPPSSDGLAKPAPKSLRKKSGKKPGGQKGHPGSTRELVDTPDHVIVHPVDECHACGCDLHRKNADSMERRQVWEIPPIVVEVTEHQFLSKTCHQCGAVTTSAAMAPADVQAPVQFGRRLQAVAVYLKEYQLLPYERSAEVFADLLFPASFRFCNMTFDISQYLHSILPPDDARHEHQMPLGNTSVARWKKEKATERIVFGCLMEITLSVFLRFRKVVCIDNVAAGDRAGDDGPIAKRVDLACNAAGAFEDFHLG